MGMLQTEFEFSLPLGFVDGDGGLHKEGTMRLATAADEILPQKDPRVHQNPAYMTVILLSRVVTKLGNLTVTPKIVEELFSADFAFLQDLYNRINETGSDAITTECPKCNHSFEIQLKTAE